MEISKVIEKLAGNDTMVLTCNGCVSGKDRVFPALSVAL